METLLTLSLLILAATHASESTAMFVSDDFQQVAALSDPEPPSTWTTFQFRTEKNDLLNISEALAEDGNSLVLSCPRIDNKPGNSWINVIGATYSTLWNDRKTSFQSLTAKPAKKSASKGARFCDDVRIVDDAAQTCDFQTTCTVDAADPANSAACQQRPLRVAYTCTPRTRRMGGGNQVRF